MSTLSEYLIGQLHNQGIKHAFGIPGDYISSLYKNFHDSNKIKVINTTREESAGFAADAYARVNGFGLVLTTYCVGGFNLINSVAGAYREKSRMVVVSGSPGMEERKLSHNTIKSFECQHELFSKITCANTVLRSPATAGYEIDRVLKASKKHSQPVYIEVPKDMIDKQITHDPYQLQQEEDKKTDFITLKDVIEQVKHYINTSKNPVILAGVEIARFGLGEKLQRFAEMYNLPVATTILGKSVINETHPLSIGTYMGTISNSRTQKFIDESDCLIMLGVIQTDVNFGFLPLKIGQRNIVLCTSETLQIKNSHYDDVPFMDFMDSLMKLDLLSRCVTIERKEKKEYFAEKNKKITTDRLFEKIDCILTENNAIISDVGDSLFGASNLTVQSSNVFLSQAFYTNMGFAIPGTLGVMMAKPKLRPIVFVGDGAFQMTGTEISTLVKLKLNPIIFVLNNKGFLTERFVVDGPFNDLPNWNYHEINKLVGHCNGFIVQTEEELDIAYDEAVKSKYLSVINVCLDQKDASLTLRRMITKLSLKK